MRVGFIGLGLMGSAMACRLLESGHDVFLYNRTRLKAERVVKECGGTVASSPREAAERSEVVHVMVSDDEAVASVLLGDAGALAGEADAVVVSSTITPTFSSVMSDLAKSLGKRYAEAPVLGSVSEARGGRLITYVAGPEDLASLETIRDLSSSVVYVGEVPRASALKLAINNVFLTLLASLAQSVGLATSYGFETGEVLQHLKNTWLRPVIERYESRGLDESFPTRFPMELAAKDLMYVATASQRVGIPSTLP
ncbi:MAG: NAD(P)-dependent oxidoreductase, partial [Desulfurococcales archaeon]|nr:NAD(P)-dependent oxidoreductase [Desulfurococcales archaeon]